MKYIWAAAGVTALAVIGSYTATPLWAQVKAALVQSIDEPGRNPYTSEVLFSGATCDPGVCHINFAPVPAGKRLVATSLTGVVYLVTPGVVGRFRLSAFSPLGGTEMALPTVLQAGLSTFGSNMIGVNSQFAAYFEPGTTPQAVILPTTMISMIDPAELTLSGYLVSVP